MHRRAAAMQAALNWTIILLIDQGHFLRPSSIVCIFASQYYTERDADETERIRAEKDPEQTCSFP